MLYRICSDCRFRIPPHTGICPTCGTRTNRQPAAGFIEVLETNGWQSRLQRSLAQAVQGLLNDVTELARSSGKLIQLIRGSVGSPREQH
jgi:RNA polymerase subunit RPABC4/transcription elongation factor Spt4